MLKYIGSVWGWSGPGGLIDGTYILSPFENRFVRLKLLRCQDSLSSQGFLAKYEDFY